MHTPISKMQHKQTIHSKDCVHLFLCGSYGFIRSRVPRFLCCSGMPCIMMRSLRLWWATAVPTGTRLVCGNRDREKKKEKTLNKFRFSFYCPRMHVYLTDLKKWWHSKHLTSIISTACDDVWKQTKDSEKKGTGNKTKSGNKHYKHIHEIKNRKKQLKVKSCLKGC